jgi:hypothetical protein
MDRAEVSQTTQLTWVALTKLEPRLLDVIRDARAVRGGEAARWVAYERLKRRLSALVGWYAETDDATLCGQRAYELALRQLVAALGV